MANKQKRNNSGKIFFNYVGILIIGIVIGAFLWKVAFNFIDDKDSIDNKSAESIYSDTNEDVSEEEIAFEGVKLRDITSYKMCNYIDFTIPYSWTVGRIEVDDAATEEAIAVTNNNSVMTILLRNIETDSLKWARESLMIELKNTYSDYRFTKSEMFGENTAIIEGSNVNSDAMLYIAIIPARDKTLLVSYVFSSDDWLADLYFTAAISEMVEKI